jgi:hypothetical protein
MPDLSRLRFGIMCSGPRFHKWEADMLRALLQIPELELVLLIIDARPPIPPNPWWKRLLTLLRAKGVLYSFYMRHFVEPYCEANREEDVSELVKGVPQQRCRVQLKGSFSEYFTEEDIATIRTYELDFVLRSGFNIIRGDILMVARFGVWSFHHDDIEKYRGGPAAFWEIFHGDPETGVTLQRLTDRLDGGVILKRGSTATSLCSYAQNLSAALFLGTNWPAEVCRDILAGRTEPFFQPAVRTHAPIYYRPTNTQMLVYLSRLLRRCLAGGRINRSGTRPEDSRPVG